MTSSINKNSHSNSSDSALDNAKSFSNSLAQITVVAEITPNPATLKFKFSQSLVDGLHEFTNVSETDRSPLAAKLFGFPWTQAVLIGADFVAVTKQDWVDWDVLAEPLTGLIQEHITSELPLLIELAIPDETDIDEEQPSDSAVVRQIKNIIKKEIKPMVAMDGGDVSFVKYEHQILFVRMKGACSGCPSSKATLKQGIEVRMKEIIPEIKEVISI